MPLTYEDTLNKEMADVLIPMQSIPPAWNGKEAILVYGKNSGQRRRISGLMDVAPDGSNVKVTKHDGKFRVLYPNQLCRYFLAD